MRPLNKEMKYLCQMHTSFQMHIIIIYLLASWVCLNWYLIHFLGAHCSAVSLGFDQPTKSSFPSSLQVHCFQ